jgi:hypothetical protein
MPNAWRTLVPIIVLAATAGVSASVQAGQLPEKLRAEGRVPFTSQSPYMAIGPTATGAAPAPATPAPTVAELAPLSAGPCVPTLPAPRALTSGTSERCPSWKRCKQQWQDCSGSCLEVLAAPRLGNSVNAHGKVPVAHGDAAGMALCHRGFVDGQLTDEGKYQVAQIATRLPTNFLPVVIEASPEAPGLDEARRAAVLNELAQYDFPVPAERVVVGAVPATKP